MIVTILSFFFSASPLLAYTESKICNGSVGKGHYYPVAELAPKMESVANAAKGVTALEYYGQSWSAPGSAVVVSNNGHLLLTSHQIEACLKDQKLFDKDGYVQSPPAELICELSMKDSGRAKAKVLFTRACSSSTAVKLEEQYFHGLLPEKSLTDAQRKCLIGKDLALVQVGPEHVKGLTCLPISTTPPPVGAKIMTVGFPDNTSRRGLRNVEDQGYLGSRRAYAMFGEVLNTNECSIHYTSDEVDMLASLSQTESIARDKIALHGLLQTDLLSQTGNSGGPVLNQNGEVIGLTTLSVRPGATRAAGDPHPCRGGQFTTPLSSLQASADMWNWNTKAKLPHLECDKKTN